MKKTIRASADDTVTYRKRKRPAVAGNDPGARKTRTSGMNPRMEKAKKKFTERFFLRAFERRAASVPPSVWAAIAALRVVGGLRRASLLLAIPPTLVRSVGKAARVTPICFVCFRRHPCRTVKPARISAAFTRCFRAKGSGCVPLRARNLVRVGFSRALTQPSSVTPFECNAVGG